jgi:hypothetical protein
MSAHDIQETWSPLEPFWVRVARGIGVLQLERLQSTLQHAYANNANYRRNSTRRAFIPMTCARCRFGALSVHHQGRLAGGLSVRIFLRADGTSRASSRVLRHHRQADGGGLHPNDLATWGNLVARSIRAAGGRAGMKVHIAYGYGLFTGGLGAHYGAEAAGCTVIPMSGGQTEKQVQLIRDFEPDIIMVTPSYMLAILDEFKRQGSMRARRRCASAYSAPSRGATACARKSNPRSTSTPATSTACRKSWGPAWRRSSRAPRTAPRSGKTISSPRSSIR